MNNIEKKTAVLLLSGAIVYGSYSYQISPLLNMNDLGQGIANSISFGASGTVANVGVNIAPHDSQPQIVNVTALTSSVLNTLKTLS